MKISLNTAGRNKLYLNNPQNRNTRAHTSDPQTEYEQHRAMCTHNQFQSQRVRSTKWINGPNQTLLIIQPGCIRTHQSHYLVAADRRRSHEDHNECQDKPCEDIKTSQEEHVTNSQVGHKTFDKMADSTSIVTCKEMETYFTQHEKYALRWSTQITPESPRSKSWYNKYWNAGVWTPNSNTSFNTGQNVHPTQLKNHGRLKSPSKTTKKALMSRSKHNSQPQPQQKYPSQPNVKTETYQRCFSTLSRNPGTHITPCGLKMHASSK